TRIYAPLVAGHLAAKADGRRLTVECEDRSHRRTDDDGKPLGHLRCDFVFTARFPLTPDRPQSFSFHEGNFYLQRGLILLCQDFGPVVPLVTDRTTSPLLLCVGSGG